MTRTPTPSPNIWGSPIVYERLNCAADPDRLVAAALDRLVGTVALAVDVGCGTGFHLPLLAGLAERVVGVEPHPVLAGLAERRVRRARLDDRVQVRRGVAESLPLADDSADLVFSHWAYFFGPGCEAGVADADRVLAPRSMQVAVDLDVSASHGYARWFATSGTAVRSDRVAGYFHSRGWHEERLPVVWHFRSRDDLAAVLGIEFPPPVAEQALSETVGCTIAVPTVVRWRRTG